MSNFPSDAIGGPLDGLRVNSETAPRDGDRRHIDGHDYEYRWSHSTPHRCYAGVWVYVRRSNVPG
jgi:hypothetical protein